MDTQLTIARQAQQYDPITIIERDPKLSPRSKQKYIQVLQQYLDTGHGLDDVLALNEFARTLCNSRRSHLRAAVRKWTKYLSTMIKGSVTPETVLDAHASLMRFEALTESIEVKQPEGQKTHIWLSQTQVRQLYQSTNGGIEGERDRVALGLMVAAGLRCQEVIDLTFDDVKLQPIEGKMRTVLQVIGKGSKARTVPISDNLANLIDVWGRRIGHEGHIIRSLGRNREPGDSYSGPALFKLVQRNGEKIGKPELAPHDLRRTYAQLGLASGISITQISKLLGHSNVATTQRYLNLDLDLETTVSDFIPWN